MSIFLMGRRGWKWVDNYLNAKEEVENLSWRIIKLPLNLVDDERRNISKIG